MELKELKQLYSKHIAEVKNMFKTYSITNDISYHSLIIDKINDFNKIINDIKTEISNSIKSKDVNTQLGNTKYYNEKDIQGKKVFKYGFCDIFNKKCTYNSILTNSFADTEVFLYNNRELRWLLCDTMVYDTPADLANNGLKAYSYTNFDRLVTSHLTKVKKESSIIVKLYESISYNFIAIGNFYLRITDNAKNIEYNKAIKDIIPIDVQESISMMLKSEDPEIFSLGWNTIWQYDFIKSKDIILQLYCTANKKSFRKRKQITSQERAFKQWKKQYTML